MKNDPYVIKAGDKLLIPSIENGAGTLAKTASSYLYTVFKPGYEHVLKFTDDASKEAQIMQLISKHHPEIVPRVLSFTEDCVCMERIYGQTLDEHCKGLTLDKKLDVLIALAEGLAKLEALNVIHFDLKPLNLIVAPNDGIVFIDFGISPNAIDYFDPKTQHRATFRYASPERLVPVGSIYSKFNSRNTFNDILPHLLRSEIFSLGTIIFQTITNYPFYYYASGSMLGKIPRSAEEELQIIKTLLENENSYKYKSILDQSNMTSFKCGTHNFPPIPPQIASILSQMLQSDPDQRPDSFREVVIKLKEARGDEF